jgi:hypothetical protein
MVVSVIIRITSPLTPKVAARIGNLFWTRASSRGHLPLVIALFFLLELRQRFSRVAMHQTQALFLGRHGTAGILSAADPTSERQCSATNGPDVVAVGAIAREDILKGELSPSA